MEAPKRPLDLSYAAAAAAAGEPNPASPSPSSSSSSSASAPKRRQPPSARGPFRSPPPLKPSSVRIIFRILCPADKSGGVVGKGGAFLRRCREETGARIRVEDPVPGSDERVVVVVAEAQPRRWAEPGGGEAEADASPAQRALIRVFERILRVDEDGLADGVDGGGGTKEKETHGLVLCRLLAQGNQVGSVLGKGGKVVEKIRQGSGAQVRVFGKDQVPTCASAGDELIHISGSFSSVKKALLSVSSCLQDYQRTEPTSSARTVPLVPMDSYAHWNYLPSPHVSEYHFRGYAPNPGAEISPSSQRKVEVVFRMLCSNDKVWSIIGKGGIVIRTMQNETGASIKIADPVSDSDERVITISANEISELCRSPAQDAVLRVHSRLSEMLDKGSAVAARLLVPSHQIGCLLGKGGAVIAEMRRATGASIRIFLKEQVPKCAQPNDEVVQVTGAFQSVQNALFLITSRIRDIIFPFKTYSSAGIGQSAHATYEMPFALPTSRHELTPSRANPPISISDTADHAVGFHNTLDRQHPVSQSVDQLGVDRGSYGNDTTRPCPATDRAAPTLTPEVVNSGNTRRNQDAGKSLDFESGLIGSGSQANVVRSKTVEVVVPQQYLGFVYGDNGSNLADLREISGAKVAVRDPKPGATEGAVTISGTLEQTRTAQSLLHAFILCGLEHN